MVPWGSLQSMPDCDISWSYSLFVNLSHMQIHQCNGTCFIFFKHAMHSHKKRLFYYSRIGKFEVFGLDTLFELSLGRIMEEDIKYIPKS